MPPTSYWSLFGILCASATVLMLCWLLIVPRLSSRWRATSRKNAIAEEYEQLVRIRQEAVYHFYWAVERKDLKEADAHELSVLEIDQRLADLKRTYFSLN